MLVDTRSLTDILYLQAYDRLCIPQKYLKPVSTPLTGFTRHSIYLTGIDELDLIVGEAPRTVTVRASFKVVDIPDPSYNGLLGRPLLNALRAIEPPWQKLELESRTAVMKMNKKETSRENDPEEKESEKRYKPHKELELIPFEEGDDAKTFRLRTRLPPRHLEEIIALVRKFSEVFAWGPDHMPGVDPDIPLHRLHVNPSFRPIKQKKRNFLLEI
ncbi:hypothetical protein LIER_18344 [Lithospermum erythrorhizon]|uniref:Uncharacterized protein n=1 Tax=Lithospermum erythrorhizon TaxID=34254 RepID=A0AAV3QDN4_LITER